ncbi:MAG: RNA-binding protein [Planctomycetes bacterium]|nr:RNA-binding protein [Planctomycetota bacterium]
MSRLYVGHLSQTTTEDSLRALMTQDGRTVTHVNIKRDAVTGKLRGFAFVDMGSPEEAAAAISALQGARLDGNTIKVGNAKELPQPRSGSSRDFGGRSGGGRPRW